jgi:hypothetical protein
MATQRAWRRSGRPVVSRFPSAWVQDALDLLERDGEVRVDVATLGHRSAFVGAVLSTLPGVEVDTRPAVVRCRSP